MITHDRQIENSNELLHIDTIVLQYPCTTRMTDRGHSSSYIKMIEFIGDDGMTLSKPRSKFALYNRYTLVELCSHLDS